MSKNFPAKRYQRILCTKIRKKCYINIATFKDLIPFSWRKFRHPVYICILYISVFLYKKIFV